ncbi:transporter [Octadecabacter sp. R77987]|uniref:transporter n=1 Tax=Octadecabacter sp. R77987 TaxID=3093874 RepID=UPI00366C8B2E
MNKFLTTGAALLLTTTSAFAAGLDRSGQSIGVIFEEGNYAELSFGSVTPSVSSAALGGANMAPSYTQFGFAYKHQFDENLSLSLIVDQPYGADVAYVGLPIAGVIDSLGITAVGRYEVNENISFHAGLRFLQTSGELTLGGFSNTYDPASGTGYLIGAAYERPDIALRVALTYSSAIEITHDGVLAPTTLVAAFPQSVNLDFQTGVAADTLVFGSIRWAEWSAASLTESFPAVGQFYAPSNDGMTYNIGVGRRFSDNLSGSITIGYEAAQGGIASPFAPTDGNLSLQVGAAYTLDSGVEVSGGVRYIHIGDATADFTPFGGGPADFTDNSAVAVGLKVAYNY